MSTARRSTPVSRSPNGCNAPPIYLSLTPDERSQVEALATADHRTLGATARLLLLRGLAVHEKHPDQSLAR